MNFFGKHLLPGLLAIVMIGACLVNVLSPVAAAAELDLVLDDDMLLYELTYASTIIDYDDLSSVSGYALDAVDLCRRYNIMHGYNANGDYFFNPLSAITRQEMFRVAYALNSAGQTGKSGFLTTLARSSSFIDKADIADWALDSAGYCISTGLFIGDHENRLNPTAHITYFECAVVCLRLIGYVQETLDVAPTETVEQWRQRILELAGQCSLFAQLTCDAENWDQQAITRQDVAVMCQNLLACHTVAYYPVQNEAVYMQNSQTVEERSFGKVTQESAMVVGLTDEEYILANGSRIHAPNWGKTDVSCFGRVIQYYAAERNPALSWNGSYAEGERTTNALSTNAVLEFTSEGNVMLRLGDRALIYAITDSDVVYLCNSSDGSVQTVTYPELQAELTAYRQEPIPLMLRAVIHASGKLQSLLVTRLPSDSND